MSADKGRFVDPYLWDYALCPRTPCSTPDACWQGGRCHAIDEEGWRRIAYDTLTPRLGRR